jgi:hypothetical protein
MQSFKLLMDSSSQQGSALDALLEQWASFFMPAGIGTSPTQAEIDAWEQKVQSILSGPPNRTTELQ